MIHTPHDLKRASRLIPLQPFGLAIEAKEPGQPLDICGALLETLLRAETLIVFRDFKAFTRDGLLGFSKSYPRAELLHWESGSVMEMKVDPEAKNYLFTREAVPFHWDGAFHQVPSYLVFQCLQSPRAQSGGETLFTHTQLIWDAAAAEEQALWRRLRLTYRTEKLAHYGGSFTTEMVQKHPHVKTTILRYAEPVTTKLNPVSLEIAGHPHPEALIEDFQKRLYDPRFCYAHAWKENDLIIADNHALVHGRRAFSVDSPRHLRRIQIL